MHGKEDPTQSYKEQKKYHSDWVWDELGVAWVKWRVYTRRTARVQQFNSLFNKSSNFSLEVGEEVWVYGFEHNQIHPMVFFYLYLSSSPLTASFIFQFIGKPGDCIAEIQWKPKIKPFRLPITNSTNRTKKKALSHKQTQWNQKNDWKEKHILGEKRESIIRSIRDRLKCLVFFQPLSATTTKPTVFFFFEQIIWLGYCIVRHIVLFMELFEFAPEIVKMRIQFSNEIRFYFSRFVLDT